MAAFFDCIWQRAAMTWQPFFITIVETFQETSLRLFNDNFFEVGVTYTYQINTLGRDGELSCFLRVHGIVRDTFAQHIKNLNALPFRMTNHNLMVMACPTSWKKMSKLLRKNWNTKAFRLSSRPVNVSRPSAAAWKNSRQRRSNQG